MSTLRVILVIAVLALGGFAQAQAPPPTNQSPAAPTIGEADALKLDNALLRIENTQLQIQRMQQALEKMQADLQAYGKTLEREGYHLQRGQDGAWQYVPAPKQE